MLSLAGGVRFEWQPGQGLGFADVELPQGGTLLVLGPSGAGKSTLLALIAGLLTPSAGRVVALNGGRVAQDLRSVGHSTNAEREA